GGHDVFGGRAVRVTEILNGPPVRRNGVHSRVHRLQNVLGAGDRLADPLALAAYALGDSRQHRLELGHLDLIENADEAVEHRVDFGADVTRGQHRVRGQTRAARVLRVDEVDVLGPECGGGFDLWFDIGRDHADLIG